MPMRNVIPLSPSSQTTCHLGNNRKVVDANGAMQQVTNYYPFGASYADVAVTAKPLAKDSYLHKIL